MFRIDFNGAEDDVPHWVEPMEAAALPMQDGVNVLADVWIGTGVSERLGEGIIRQGPHDRDLRFIGQRELQSAFIEEMESGSFGSFEKRLWRCIFQDGHVVRLDGAVASDRSRGFLRGNLPRPESDPCEDFELLEIFANTGTFENLLVLRGVRRPRFS